MLVRPLPLPGALLMELTRHADERGDFVKTFAASALRAAGVDFRPAEQFVTRSGQDVIRGLHFQLPPHQHQKLVYCLSGHVQDVLLDLRRGPTYGQVLALELEAERPQLLLIPEGVAHGFRVRSQEAVMLYATTSEHQPSHDAGILWRSIDHDWHCSQPVVSARDQRHPDWASFESPF